MPKVKLDAPAPDFVLNDLEGRPVSMSDYRGDRHLLLVFNRGFT